MSNLSNDRLLEEAKEAIDYWRGTLHAKYIQKALEDNDLEALYWYVKQARSAMEYLESGL